MKAAAHRVNRLALVSLAGLAAACACGQAHAQSTWLNPVDGVWSDASKWSSGVPNGIAAVVNQPGTYNIAFNGNYSIPSLTQSVPGVTITILDNLSYSVTGPISNAGVLRVNDGTGGNGTAIRLVNGSQAISGTGVIRLSSNGNVNTAQLTTNSGSWTMTQNAGHSIRGDGAIYVPIDNAGLISADTSGRTLYVQNGNTNNTGLLRAENGATLQFNSVNVSGVGQMQANGGTVLLTNSGVTSHTFSTTGGGVFNVQNSTVNGVVNNGQIAVLDNTSLNVLATGLTNNGTVEINNGAGNNGTYLRLNNGTTTLDGSGTLRLRSSGNLDTAQVTTNSGSWTLNHGANHQIRGDGRIYVPINNMGSIIADTNGRNLEILNTNSSNSGLISAENGGIFRLASAGLTQTGAGQIRALTSSSIFLDSSTIVGGALSALGSSSITVRNSTFDQVNVVGQVLIADNTNLNIPANGFINNSNISVNNGSGNNGTYLRVVGGSTAITGTGSITLNATANLDTAQITTNSGNWTLTASAGQTIRGTGSIYTPLANNGTIIADRAGAQLRWLNSSSTNNSLVTTAGGTFALSSVTLTQGANGRIVAANGDVSLVSSNIIGGTVEGTGSPVYVYNSTFTNPTVSGDVRVVNFYTLNLPPEGLVNNGTIRVSDGIGANATYIRLIGGSSAISGTGTILMDANNNKDTAQLTTNSGNWNMTIGSGQTVRGTGSIYTPIANNGLMVADRTGLPLDWANSTSTNNSTARTANGGEFRFSSMTLNQSPAGQVVASDGPVNIWSSAINGGTVNGQNSPVNVYNSTFASLTTVGDIRVPNFYTLNLPTQGINNNGTITVSDGVNGNATYLRLVSGSSTLSGAGSVVLKANNSLDTAQLTTNSGNWTMTFAATQSLRGTGNVYTPIAFAGTLNPGVQEFFTGTIGFRGSPVTIAPSGRAVFDVLSPSDYDRAIGNSNWTIQGGTLTIRFPGGFVGALGQSYTLIAGNSVSGTFDTIQLPAHPTPGLKYGIDYRPNAVILRTTCNIDFNSDGVLDLFDYLDFVQIFQAGTLQADYNGDGITDFFDYLDFVAEFAAGCN